MKNLCASLVSTQSGRQALKLAPNLLLLPADSSGHLVLSPTLLIACFAGSLAQCPLLGINTQCRLAHSGEFASDLLDKLRFRENEQTAHLPSGSIAMG